MSAGARRYLRGVGKKGARSSVLVKDLSSGRPKLGRSAVGDGGPAAGVLITQYGDGRCAHHCRPSRPARRISVRASSGTRVDRSRRALVLVLCGRGCYRALAGGLYDCVAGVARGRPGQAMLGTLDDEMQAPILSILASLLAHAPVRAIAEIGPSDAEGGWPLPSEQTCLACAGCMAVQGLYRVHAGHGRAPGTARRTMDPCSATRPHVATFPPHIVAWPGHRSRQRR